MDSVIPPGTDRTAASAGEHRSRRFRRSSWAVALVLPMLLGFAVRLIGLDQIVAADGIHLIDPDSHYHSWRMTVAKEHLPALPPPRDPYIAFPQGYLQVWPPGFDYLGAALASLFQVSATDEGLERLGTILVVALGALTCLVVVLVLKLLTTPLWAALGGLLLALWPIHVEYSRIGRVDHHVLEPLFALLVVLFYLGACLTGQARRRWIMAALCGLSMGSAFWLWPTAFLPMIVLGGGIILHQLGRATPGIAVLVFLPAVILLAPLSLSEPYRHSWALHTPSLLHLLIMGSLLGAALWSGAVKRCLGQCSARRQILLILGGSGVLALIPLLALLRGGGLQVALAFGERYGLWGMIFEQRSLFALPWRHVVLLGTYLLFLYPLLGIMVLGAESQVPRGEGRWLVIWTTLFVVLGLLQVRFLPLAVGFLAVISPLGFAALAERARHRLQRRSMPSGRPRETRGLSLVLFLVALGLLSPAVRYLGGERHMPTAVTQGIEEAARWLRQQPKLEAPAVLAPLSAGQLVVHLAHLPVVGSTLVAPNTEAANRDALEMFVTSDEQRAIALTRQRQIGRIVVSRLTPETYERFVTYVQGASVPRDSLAHYSQSLAVRLIEGDGAGQAAKGSPPLTWIKHEWESRHRPHAPPAKVFRIVKGAVLQGQAAPRQTVMLLLLLSTNQGRIISYADQQITDDQGRYQLTVPYWTEEETVATGARLPPRTMALGQARLKSGQAEVHLAIHKVAVIEGHRLAVPSLRER